tara:strand:- start:122 stop:664 length:543 start_codon:yes stop_codon:yes gene_type:complete
MNYLDIIIIISLSYGLIKGFSKGIIKELTTLLALIMGIYIATNFSLYLENTVSDFLGVSKKALPLITFFLLFFVTFLLVRVFGGILDKLTKALSLGVISKILGAVFGVVKMIIIMGFLYFIERENKILKKSIYNDSILIEPLERATQNMYEKRKTHKKILNKIENETKKIKEKIEGVNFE